MSYELSQKYTLYNVISSPNFHIKYELFNVKDKKEHTIKEKDRLSFHRLVNATFPADHDFDFFEQIRLTSPDRARCTLIIVQTAHSLMKIHILRQYFVFF
jgi:hypothetical protein